MKFPSPYSSATVNPELISRTVHILDGRGEISVRLFLLTLSCHDFPKGITMKFLTIIAILFSLQAFAQTTSAQLELESAVFRNDHVGILSFDIIVDQDLQTFSERDIERLKVSVLDATFGGGNLELQTSFLSLKRNSNPISNDERYSVNQIQLMSARIVKVIPLRKGFKITLSAHAGLGFTVNGLVNQNNEVVRDAEYKLFKLARECMDCVKETIRQVGYMPVEAGVRIQLNRNNSYFALSGDYRQSGKTTTIPGEDRFPLNMNSLEARITENKTIIPLSFELGHQIASGPVTVYAKGERISYSSKISSDAPVGNYPGFTDQDTNHFAFRVGVRLKFRGLLGR